MNEVQRRVVAGAVAEMLGRGGKVPPPSDGLDGELGGVGDVTDGDPASSLATSSVPSGMALANSPKVRSAKSCTCTRSGSPSGDHSAPPLA